jgi:PadR family transcriptional regulator, regulatory protein PadR
MEPAENPRTRHQYRHLPAAILLELAEHPLHGGAIHTALSGLLPDFKPDTGAIYRTLQKLEREGEIESAWDTANPGPARKIYHLTPKGWEKLAVWKEDIEKRQAFLAHFLVIYERLDAQRRAGRPKPKSGA